MSTVLISIEEQDLDLALKVLPDDTKSMCKNCLVANALKRVFGDEFRNFNGLAIIFTNYGALVPDNIEALANKFDCYWNEPNSKEISEIRNSLPIQFEIEIN